MRVPQFAGARMGQRDGFSDGDVSKLNSMYRCNEPEPSYSGYAPTAAAYPYDAMFNYGGYSNGYGAYPTGYGGYPSAPATAPATAPAVQPSMPSTATANGGYYGRR